MTSQLTPNSSGSQRLTTTLVPASIHKVRKLSSSGAKKANSTVQVASHTWEGTSPNRRRFRSASQILMQFCNPGKQHHRLGFQKSATAIKKITDG